MGFSPQSGGVSLRTFNRNFEGRSGTRDAQVYLVSPQTAANTAVAGEVTDPASWGTPPQVALPDRNWKLIDWQGRALPLVRAPDGQALLKLSVLPSYLVRVR